MRRRRKLLRLNLQAYVLLLLLRRLLLLLTFPMKTRHRKETQQKDHRSSHSFAATKEEGAQPTGGRKPWPPYMYRDDEAAGAKSSTMQLDSELEVLRGFKDEDCQFWERERRRRRQRRRRQQSRGGD
jgi:hypothetical protein